MLSKIGGKMDFSDNIKTLATLLEEATKILWGDVGYILIMEKDGSNLHPMVTNLSSEKSKELICLFAYSLLKDKKVKLGDGFEVHLAPMNFEQEKDTGEKK